MSSTAEHAGGAEVTGSTGPVLAVSHVTKSFGAVVAISDASIELFAGEAHALVGENGAGKSTLVKMLAGVHQPDSGVLRSTEPPLSLNSPAAARDAGDCGDLPGADDVPGPRRRGEHLHGPHADAGLASARPRRACGSRSCSCSRSLDVRLDPKRAARGLSIADQQIVEIAKALTLDARVLVMDEPTAALSGGRS